MYSYCPTRLLLFTNASAILSRFHQKEVDRVNKKPTRPKDLLASTFRTTTLPCQSTNRAYLFKIPLKIESPKPCNKFVLLLRHLHFILSYQCFITSFFRCRRKTPRYVVKTTQRRIPLFKPCIVQRTKHGPQPNLSDLCVLSG